jgi:hypothetical protein
VKPQPDVAIDEILLLPRAGYQTGDEVGNAKELLSEAGIMVVTYEYVETHALLPVRALDCDVAIQLLTRNGLKASRLN